MNSVFKSSFCTESEYDNIFLIFVLVCAVTDTESRYLAIVSVLLL